jgi:alpha-D-ribose 1-methylphosphonate 5-triphosphate synthase subunit PhnH
VSAPLAAAVLEGAFADPPREAQAVFRAILAALAEPGRRQTLPVAVRPPAPFPPALGAIALTLCDGQTPVFLDREWDDDLAGWITFHTGAPVTRRREDARFAFLREPDLSGFSVGTDAYPDRSATIVAAARLAGEAFTLEGPGIARERRLEAAFPPGFVEALAANRALFPRGVDCLLVDGETLVGLPRTTRVRPAGVEPGV